MKAKLSELIDVCVQMARKSNVRSKHGAIIYDPHTGKIIASGCNYYSKYGGFILTSNDIFDIFDGVEICVRDGGKYSYDLNDLKSKKTKDTSDNPCCFVQDYREKGEED